MPTLSPRLAAIVDALPLKPGMRVLEVGCGPGAAARAVAERIGHGQVVAIDRSPKAIAAARRASLGDDRAVEFREMAAEDFALDPGEPRFDLAFAVRVGALDGRHPVAGVQARRRIAAALKPGGKLLIDGGDPLREVALES